MSLNKKATVVTYLVLQSAPIYVNEAAGYSTLFDWGQGNDFCFELFGSFKNKEFYGAIIEYPATTFHRPLDWVLMPDMLKMSYARCVLQEWTRTFEVINLSIDNVLSGKLLCRYNSWGIFKASHSRDSRIPRVCPRSVLSQFRFKIYTFLTDRVKSFKFLEGFAAEGKVLQLTIFCFKFSAFLTCQADPFLRQFA